MSWDLLLLFHFELNFYLVRCHGKQGPVNLVPVGLCGVLGGVFPELLAPEHVSGHVCVDWRKWTITELQTRLNQPKDFSGKWSY